MNTLLSYLLVTLYVLTIAGVIVVILSENRNPLKSLSWVIVLVLAPGVGLVCYFFFGQNLSKRRTISRRLRKQLEGFIRQSHR
ncbi:MAG: PLDc N-terminal domain-containing protein, partial [Alistipes sp.]|nr:PLDc N-terminal domain-containing protein [Alistipes sp.]